MSRLIPIAALSVLVLASCKNSDVPRFTDVPVDTLPSTPSRYVATDMGSLGGARSEPLSISDSGVVVGWSTIGESVRPFVWQNGVMSLLPSSTNDPGTIAAAVGDGDVIAGVGAEGRIALWEDGVLRTITVGQDVVRAEVLTVDASGGVLARVGSTVDLRAVVINGGAVMDLGGLSATPNTLPYAMNNNGQVVGESQAQAAPAIMHPFLWAAGEMQDLGVLGGFSSGVALDINERGEIVGMSSDGENTRPFIWRNGVLQDLGAFPGARARAMLINDSGVVAGETGADGSEEAFVWRNGATTSLGTLGGAHTRVAALNNSGLVVGTSRNAAGEWQAYVWQNGRMIALDALGGRQSAAVGINERGDIIGWSEAVAGPGRRAILWRYLP